MGKYRPEKTPNLDTFYAAPLINLIFLHFKTIAAKMKKTIIITAGKQGEMLLM